MISPLDKLSINTSKKNVFTIVVSFLVFFLFRLGNINSKQIWKNMQIVIDNFKCPSFPNKTYSINDCRAKADGVTYNTEAFKKAIEACSKKGGVDALVQKGGFLSRSST